MTLSNLVLINALTHQIESLKIANQRMSENWGTYTNGPGFEAANHSFMKALLEKDYVSPFEAPFNGGVKPFLADMYKEMNLEIIKDLERKIETIKNEQSGS